MTMDYDSFMKDWTLLDEYQEGFDLWKEDKQDKDAAKEPIVFGKSTIKGGVLTELEGKHATNDDWLSLDKPPLYAIDFSRPTDPVHRPAHYTKGKQEAIDTIEDAIADAPSAKAGFLQGQTLKYLLRLWHKGNSVQDAQKAEWYLSRLIQTLN